MALALVLFALTYVLMIMLPNKRLMVVACSAVIFLVAGILPFGKLFVSVNWNVLMMLAGTMVTVELFIDSKMPARLADQLLYLAPNTMWVVVILALFAGVISAFVDNVATVLMVAPVGLAIAKKLDISPVSMLICISVSSNLQGAATLVGDTTSILLGGYANMDFLDFIFMDGKLSIFWAVELGALVTVPVIMWLFRKEKRPVQAGQITTVTNYFPTFLLLANVICLIAASFWPGKTENTNGFICIAIAVIGLLYTTILRHSAETARSAIKSVDLNTIGLLACLFLVIAGITEAGVITAISDLFVKFGGSSLFLMYSLIVWGSVVFSAFVDNIPYVATMLPVVSQIAVSMGCDPYVLYFGLLCGATLGGNLTPIGASSNITTIGILKREGYEVKNTDFMRIGIPFTLVAVLCGYVFCWIVWA